MARPHTEDAVDVAMAQVSRADFLPADQRAQAGQDRPLPLGDGQTNSQPTTVAAMLRLLHLSPGHRVLDVGAGSGWSTALLAALVGPAGLVVGVELVPRLAGWGAENLARQRMSWATLHQAQDGVLGWPALAPYDRILVSAEAAEIPVALVDQLADGGVLVTPVSGQMCRLQRMSGRSPEVTWHGAYRFVPLL